VSIKQNANIKAPILRYDDKFDILYVKFFDSKGSIGKDVDEFCVVFPKNDRISAAVIYEFKRLLKDKAEKIQRYQELLGCKLSLDFAEILPQ